MPPHQTWNDLDDIRFTGLVVAASYAPRGMTNFSVTKTIQKLQREGRNIFQAGIHTFIGCQPGISCQLSVWYRDQPTETLKDGETVTFKGSVVAASFAPEGRFIDVTSNVQRIQSRGAKIVLDGILNAPEIKDTAPGQKKVLQLWYA